METSSKLKKDWVLTPEAFAKLLAAFDGQDENRAGTEYEAARRRLIKMFRWRNLPDAEQAADETLNRAARKLEEGEIVRDIAAFIGGIARFVVLENFKSKERGQVALEDAPPAAFVRQPAEFEDDPADRPRLRCFDRCLGELSDEARALVVQYYDSQADGAVRIEHRKRLAQRLGLEMNALRNRALRTRGRLEDCLNKCFEKKR